MRRKLDDGTIVAGLNRPGYGGRGVFIFGVSDEPELRVLPALLNSGDYFIDVGANTGLYSLTAAKIVGPEGLVISIEPNVEILNQFRSNVERNGYSNVRYRCLAAGEYKDSAQFYRNDDKPNSFSLVKTDSDASGFSTLVVPLDELKGWEGLGPIKLIKIDAEGAEDGILRGARQILESDKPTLIVEVSRGGLTVLPPSYLAYSSGRGPNQLLVHETNLENFSPILEKHGWFIVT